MIYSQSARVEDFVCVTCNEFRVGQWAARPRGLLLFRLFEDVILKGFAHVLDAVLRSQVVSDLFEEFLFGLRSKAAVAGVSSSVCASKFVCHSFSPVRFPG